MKYAFLFIILSLSLLASSSAFARTIKSFNDSQALLTIAQFMSDNADDMRTSSRISDKKLIIKDLSSCEVVPASVVINEVQSAIKNILRMFPDEELPIEDAMNDLSDYIGTGLLTKCSFIQMNRQKKTLISYFFDSTNKIHVKVDTITLFLM